MAPEIAGVSRALVTVPSPDGSEPPHQALFPIRSAIHRSPSTLTSTGNWHKEHRGSIREEDTDHKIATGCVRAKRLGLRQSSAAFPTTAQAKAPGDWRTPRRFPPAAACPIFTVCGAAGGHFRSGQCWLPDNGQLDRLGGANDDSVPGELCARCPPKGAGGSPAFGRPALRRSPRATVLPAAKEIRPAGRRRRPAPSAGTDPARPPGCQGSQGQSALRVRCLSAWRAHQSLCRTAGVLAPGH